MRNSIRSFILLIFCSVTGVQQDQLKAQVKNLYFPLTQQEAAYLILTERGEVYFRFSPQTATVMAQELSGKISVDDIRNGYVYAYASPREFDEFYSLGIPFEVLTPPSLLHKLKNDNTAFSLDELNSYPSYQEYLDIMYGFASSYPGICRLDTIGFSILNRAILAVKISAEVHTTEPEPVFFYTSTMHGDEPTGYILMLKLINYLLSNYNKNSLVSRLLDESEIWINPLANPDGTYFLGNESVSGARRNNFVGKDLNRDFPDPLEGGHPDGVGYQPETIAMMEFMKKHKPDLSANLHGGTEVINYPWDTWTHTHADEDWYILISKDYADTVKAHSDGYFLAFPDGITRGIDWYRIAGGRMDYVNYYLNSREVTMELSLAKMPPESALPELWVYNREALLHYMEQALFGVAGTVRDAVSGEPVKAMIEIPDHDVDNSGIFSDSLDGSWFRYLKEGSYIVDVSAPGYIDKSIEGVPIYDRQMTRLAVRLDPLYIGMHELRGKIHNVSLKGTRLFFESEGNADARLSVFDLSGRLLGPEIHHSSRPGINEIELAGLLPGGFYLLQLTIGGQVFTLKHIQIH